MKTVYNMIEKSQKAASRFDLFLRARAAKHPEAHKAAYGLQGRVLAWRLRMARAEREERLARGTDDEGDLVTRQDEGADDLGGAEANGWWAEGYLEPDVGVNSAEVVIETPPVVDSESIRLAEEMHAGGASVSTLLASLAAMGPATRRVARDLLLAHEQQSETPRKTLLAQLAKL